MFVPVNGISKVQLIGVLFVVSLLIGFLWISFNDFQETRDAETVESVQVSLQREISKGMAALELPPREIHPLNFINAARSSFPKGAVVHENMQLTMAHSNRAAQYELTDSGDFLLVSLKNFTRFHVQDGRIVRNNHWMKR